MAESPWPVIETERSALVDDLSSLSDEQWQTPSLCTGWTVHQLLAHMVATAKMTPPKFFGRMVASGFSFERMAAKQVAAESAAGPQATLAEMKAHAGARTAPPGPVESWLGETLIHGEDIRRALGIAHAYPPDAIVRALDFYKKSNLIVGAMRRIAGLSLRATDAAWSHGSGPLVEGPAMSLLLAMTGRPAALSDLSGDGVDVLRSRL
jgi:uncharacterized protein (TIGR03083 family)